AHTVSTTPPDPGPAQPEVGLAQQHPPATGTPCVDSKSYPHPEVVSGFEMCSDGRLHRAAAVACDYPGPRGTAPEPRYPPTPEDECSVDTDCTEKPYGYCSHVEASPPPFPSVHTECRYGCKTDADCGGNGFVCECGDFGGQCIRAGCHTDADCGSGLLC